MAFDEALEQGLLDRPVEFVLHAENGLPRGSARNTADGFRYLVDQGCIGIAGAYSSDNAIIAAPLANELKIPLISWAGTERLAGDYCFRLGNGDCGGDAALCVAWLARNGYTACRRAERGLTQWRGVFSLLPPRVPQAQSEDRLARDRQPDTRRI